MALTYSQLDSLTTNASFLGRVRTALGYYANYLLNGTPTTLQRDWCGRVFYVPGNCAQMAANMAPQLVQDAAFVNSTTGDGSDVTDAALQTAVEKICTIYS